MRLTPWLSGFSRLLRSRHQWFRSPRRRFWRGYQSSNSRIARTAEWLEDRTLLATFTLTELMLDTVDASPGDGTAADSMGRTTLRAAIQEANALAGDDTIVLPTGVVQLSLSGTGEDSAATGDLDIANNGKVIITGTGGALSFVNAFGIDRVFDVLASATLELSNLTVIGGSVTGADGGGIRNNGGTLSLNGVTVEGNSADDGGGIGNMGSLTIQNSTIQMNTVSNDAGGIGITDSVGVTITNTTVSNNQATKDAGGIGIESTGGSTDVIISGSLITGNNVGEDGGGVGISSDGISAFTTVTIFNSLISGNTADSPLVGSDGMGFGGGVSIEEVNSGTTTVTITQTQINMNTAVDGGGVDMDDGTVTINDSQIDTNTANGANGMDGSVPTVGADAGGGGIFLDAGTLNLNRTRVSGNTVQGGRGGNNNAGGNGAAGGEAAGGGIFVGAAGTVNIDQSLIAGNVAAGGIGGNGDVGQTGGAGGAASGGGIFNQGTIAMLDNSTIRDNQAAGGPGGTAISGSDGNGGDAQGGGITVDGIVSSSLTATNSTISTNTAVAAANPPNGSEGGGIAIPGSSATVTLDHVTVTLNSADLGSGIRNGACTVNIGNTIVAQNAFDRDVAGGAFTTADGNLVGNVGGVSGFSGSNDQTGTMVSPVNALLGTLQNNGGATDTHELLAGSPAINSGVGSTLTDQRLQTRPSGIAPDKGAFEVVPTLVFVFTGTDKDDAVTLRQNGPEYEIVDTNTGNRLAGQDIATTSSISINLAEGADALTFELFNGPILAPVFYDGGFDEDSLLVAGGPRLSSVIHTPTAATNGTLALGSGNGLITYSNLSPGSFTVDLSAIPMIDLTLDVGAISLGTATLEDETGKLGVSRFLAPGNFETTIFANPFGRLTIVATGTAIIDLRTMDSMFMPFELEFQGGALTRFQLIDNDAIPDPTNVRVFGGQFSLSNTTDTIGSLTGTGTVFLNGSASLTTGLNPGFTSFDGNVSGNGTLIKDGPGIFQINGNNTGFTGTTILRDGTLEIGNDAALGSSFLQIEGGTITAFGAPRRLANNILLNGDFAVRGMNFLTFDGGTVTLMGSSVAIDVLGGLNLTFEDLITEASGGTEFVKNGGGVVFVNDVTTYTGDTTVNSGAFIVGPTGVISNNVIVNGPGRLEGTGLLGAQVISNGGVIVPGLSPGNLTVDSLFLDSNTIVEIELDQPISDQITVLNTVDLGGAFLDAFLLSPIPLGQPIVIINSANPIVGRFEGLPNSGDIVRAVGPGGLATFTIDYGGNDVVLTSVTPIPSAGVDNTLFPPRVGAVGNAFAELRLPGDLQFSVDFNLDGLRQNIDTDGDGSPDFFEVFFITIGVQDFGDANNPVNSVTRDLFFPIPDSIEPGLRSAEFVFTPQVSSLVLNGGPIGKNDQLGQQSFEAGILSAAPIVISNIPVNILARQNLNGTPPPAPEFVADTAELFSGTVPLGFSDRTISFTGARLLDQGNTQVDNSFGEDSDLPGNGFVDALDRQEEIINSVLRIQVDPVDFIVTDPSGRQVGFTQEQGFVNEIGDAVTYTGDGAVELLEIEGANPGQYQVEFTGVGDGDFRAVVSLITPDAVQVSTIEGNIQDTSVEVALDFSNTSFQGSTTLIPTIIGQLLDGFADSGDATNGVISSFVFSEEAAEAVQDLLGDESGFENVTFVSILDDLIRDFRRLPEFVKFFGDVLLDELRKQMGSLVVVQLVAPEWRLGSDIDANTDEDDQGNNALIDLFWMGVGESLMGIPHEMFRVRGIFENLFEQPANENDTNSTDSDSSSDATSDAAPTRRNRTRTETTSHSHPIRLDEDEKAEVSSTDRTQRPGLLIPKGPSQPIPQPNTKPDEAA